METIVTILAVTLAAIVIAAIWFKSKKPVVREVVKVEEREVAKVYSASPADAFLDPDVIRGAVNAWQSLRENVENYYTHRTEERKELREAFGRAQEAYISAREAFEVKLSDPTSSIGDGLTAEAAVMEELEKARNFLADRLALLDQMLEVNLPQSFSHLNRLSS